MHDQLLFVTHSLLSQSYCIVIGQKIKISLCAHLYFCSVEIADAVHYFMNEQHVQSLQNRILDVAQSDIFIFCPMTIQYD